MSILMLYLYTQTVNNTTMKNTIAKNYEAAKEMAASILGLELSQVRDDQSMNTRFGACTCGCGESKQIWFRGNGIDTDSVSIGLCDSCAK